MSCRDTLGLIILIEPNVDALGHADDESSSNQVDWKFGSGFQDDGGWKDGINRKK
jgi:hypothetical protein